MPLLVFVIFCVLCSFLPLFIILPCMGLAKIKQRDKEEARTFLVPAIEGDTVSAYPEALTQDCSLPGPG